MGILYDSYFFQGNGESPYQISSYIRAYNTTSCNSMEFPVGHLQDFDLRWFRKVMPVIVRNKVIELAKDTSVILYAIRHYSRKKKCHVIDGYIITNINHQLLYQNNLGKYGGFTWDYMRKAVNSICRKDN